MQALSLSLSHSRIPRVCACLSLRLPLDSYFPVRETARERERESLVCTAATYRQTERMRNFIRRATEETQGRVRVDAECCVPCSSSLSLCLEDIAHTASAKAALHCSSCVVSSRERCGDVACARVTRSPLEDVSRGLATHELSLPVPHQPGSHAALLASK